MLTALSFIMVGCENPTKSEDPANPTDEKASVTFSRNMVDIDITPMTKTESNDGIWGVQVMEGNNILIEGTKYIGAHYAFGVFDDLSKAQLDVYKAKKYNVYVVYYPDGKKIFDYVEGMKRWPQPLNLIDKDVPLNTFVYSSQSISLHQPYLVCNLTTVSRSFVPTPRYMGRVLNYEWSQSNTNLNVDMFITNFALKLVVKRPTEGEYLQQIRVAFNDHLSTEGEYLFNIDNTKDVNIFEVPYITLLSHDREEDGKTWWNSDLLQTSNKVARSIYLTIGTVERPALIYQSNMMTFCRGLKYTYEFHGAVSDTENSGIEANFIENGISGETLISIN